MFNITLFRPKHTAPAPQEQEPAPREYNEDVKTFLEWCQRAADRLQDSYDCVDPERRKELAERAEREYELAHMWISAGIRGALLYCIDPALGTYTPIGLRKEADDAI